MADLWTSDEEYERSERYKMDQFMKCIFEAMRGAALGWRPPHLTEEAWKALKKMLKRNGVPDEQRDGEIQGSDHEAQESEWRRDMEKLTEFCPCPFESRPQNQPAPAVGGGGGGAAAAGQQSSSESGGTARTAPASRVQSESPPEGNDAETSINQRLEGMNLQDRTGSDQSQPFVSKAADQFSTNNFCVFYHVRRYLKKHLKDHAEFYGNNVDDILLEHSPGTLRTCSLEGLNEASNVGALAILILKNKDEACYFHYRENLIDPVKAEELIGTYKYPPESISRATHHAEQLVLEDLKDTIIQYATKIKRIMLYITYQPCHKSIKDRIHISCFEFIRDFYEDNLKPHGIALGIKFPYISTAFWDKPGDGLCACSKEGLIELFRMQSIFVSTMDKLDWNILWKIAGKPKTNS